MKIRVVYEGSFLTHICFSSQTLNGALGLTYSPIFAIDPAKEAPMQAMRRILGVKPKPGAKDTPSFGSHGKGA